jgi:uncharacterized membrane protein
MNRGRQAIVIPLLWTARILALLGFLDATYLTVTQYAGQSVACGPGGSCEVVLTSRYAALFGVPISAFGVTKRALAADRSYVLRCGSCRIPISTASPGC